MANKLFCENNNGVHLVSIAGMTLCGDAMEGGDEHDETKNTRKRTITCPECAEIVLSCRGVHVSPELIG